MLKRGSGVARTFPGGRAARLEDQNEKEDEENLRKNEGKYRKMKKKLRKYSYLAHPGLRGWLQPWNWGVANDPKRVKRGLQAGSSGLHIGYSYTVVVWNLKLIVARKCVLSLFHWRQRKLRIGPNHPIISWYFLWTLFSWKKILWPPSFSWPPPTPKKIIVHH